MARTIQDKRTVQAGSAFQTKTLPKGAWDSCTIVDVHEDTYTCDVITSDERPVNGLPFPGMQLNPPGTGGTVYVPKRGERYALHRELNEEYLGQAIPTPVLDTTPREGHRVFHAGEPVGGIDPESAASVSLQNFRGSMPPDVLPGDWLRVGAKGNMVGVLEGGVVLLKASELSKVLATSAGDLLQLVGRNVDIFTDFGELKFRNDDGRVSMSLKGGMQQLTDSSPSEEKFTIHLDLGHSGDIANFRITDQVGNVVGQVHYKPNGSVETTNSGEVSVVNGKSEKTVFGERKTIVEGESFETVTGTTNESTGHKVTAVGTNYDIVTGQGFAVGAAQDISLSAGRVRTDTVSGSLKAVPGDAAYKTVVTNGSVVVDIGNPAAGDLMVAKSGYDLTATNDIALRSRMGRVVVETNAPNSVQLGGVAPVWHTVRGEVLEQILDILKIIAAGHVHTSNKPGDPTLPPMGTDGLPVATSPDFMRLQALIGQVKSDIVTLGG